MRDGVGAVPQGNGIPAWHFHFRSLKKGLRLTYSDQPQVTCVKRKIMATSGDSEVKALLAPQAEGEVNRRFSGTVSGKVDIAQMLTLSSSRI